MRAHFILATRKLSMHVGSYAYSMCACVCVCVCARVCVCVCALALSHFSCVQLIMTLWTVARQAPLSIGFSS